MDVSLNTPSVERTQTAAGVTKNKQTDGTYNSEELESCAALCRDLLSGEIIRMSFASCPKELRPIIDRAVKHMSLSELSELRELLAKSSACGSVQLLRHNDGNPSKYKL